MDERILREPGQDFAESRGVSRQRTARRGMNPQAQRHCAPIAVGVHPRRGLGRQQPADNAKPD